MIYGLTGAVAILFVAVAWLVDKVFSLSVELKAMQNSTHQIVMPTAMAEATFEKQTEETKRQVDAAFSDYIGIN